jgi:IS30 family transposase
MPPIPRRRRIDHLTLVEREEISRGIAAGLSARMIARRIDRPSSTVSREIARNGGRGAYRALVADAAAFERARRPKPSKLAANAQLRGVVADKLDDDWSPQQIAQRLRQEYLDDAAMRISHESIYRDVYMPSRKVFDASMFHRLRSKRSIRRPRGKKRSHGRGQIRNTVSIHQRPFAPADRSQPGHWESQWCCQAAWAGGGGMGAQVRLSRSSAHKTSARRRARAMMACWWVRPRLRFLR